MLTDNLQRSLVAIIADRYQVTDIESEITHPEAKFGDFSANVAFQLAGRLKRPPQEIGAELADVLSDVDKEIQGAVAVGGFINITMTTGFWIEQLHAIKPGYGHSDAGKGAKLQVEFISANPTGPTTIGNARGGYIGDTLARVMEALGYQVTREYYFNNAGTQIGKLLESVRVAAGLLQADEVQYRGAYIDELARDFKSDLETKPDNELKQIITQAILKRWIEPAVAKMGIQFDVWFNEQDLLVDGRFRETIGRLKEKELVYERDGATWLDTGKLGVAREARVLIKSNGDPTYLAPDIAYHDDLFGPRGFDAAIKVLGPDHVDQFPSVRAAVLALHPGKRFEAAWHQYFRLIRDGKEVKVSKRLGQFVTIEQLIDEVGPDVARFMTLMRAAESPMDFDLDLAREQSQKNPYYYIMYSYARAHSILDQADKRGMAPVGSTATLTDEETALVRCMSRFPELLHQIADDFGVHRLTFFGMDLAKLFHDLYERERIIDLDQVVASRRLYVIAQYIVFMKEYFAVLGLKPVERMEQKEQKDQEDN